MKRKIFFAFIIAVMLFPSCINALELPDSIREWHSVSERVQNLIAIAGNKNLGRCVYKTYERESPKGYMNLILTEGPGTGSLYVPERINDSKGVMQVSSGYEVLSISGYSAVLERHEYMPSALAVNISKDIILTVETGSLDDKGIIEITEELLKNFQR